MIFNEDYKERFEKEFGKADKKANGMKIKKWLSKNEDINNYLNELLKNEPRYMILGNVIWAFRNNFDINEYKCKACGKPLNLRCPTNLNDYCCTKCAMTSQDTINKRKSTISNNPDYYQKRQEKIKKTNLERYGVEVPAKSSEIVNKMKATFSKDPEIWKKNAMKNLKHHV